MGLRHSEQTDALFRSILALTSIEECYAYVEGSSYQQAASLTGVSSATIGRVKRCLDYGTGGYRMILGRLKEADARDDG